MNRDQNTVPPKLHNIREKTNESLELTKNALNNARKVQEQYMNVSKEPSSDDSSSQKQRVDIESDALHLR